MKSTPKYKAHVPTEQFGFIEIESDDRKEVVQEYLIIKKAFAEEDLEGHNKKDWARVRNTYAQKSELSLEDYENSSSEQKNILNEIKLTKNE